MTRHMLIILLTAIAPFTAGHAGHSDRTVRANAGQRNAKAKMPNNEIGYFDGDKAVFYAKGRNTEPMEVHVVRQDGFTILNKNGTVVGFKGANGKILSKPDNVTSEKVKHVAASVLKERILAQNEAITFRVKSIEELSSKIHNAFDAGCKAKTEHILYAVRLKNNVYELRRGDKGDGTNDEVTPVIRLNLGETVVFLFHNHERGLWPSEMDAVTALDYNTNMYIHGCMSGDSSVTYLSKADWSLKRPEDRDFGQVMRVLANGTPSGYVPKNEAKSCDGHGAYDFQSYDRYLAGQYACGGATASAAKPVLGAPKASTPHGYCTCAIPNCVEVVIPERTDFAAHMKRKPRQYGSIQFFCCNCGKINKSYYQKALKLKATQEKQGLPTDWFDMQQRAVDATLP